MSLATTYSRALAGINAPLVTIEVHISNGLPSLSMVGLPETAVKESKDRVRSALLACRFEFPAKRITINLAPADLPKSGSRYDLAIALSVLAASQQIDSRVLTDYEIIGELALSGAIRPVNGILPAALQTREQNRTLIVTTLNASEAALVHNTRVLAVDHLLTLCEHLQQSKPIELYQAKPATNIRPATTHDMADVRGQQHARRVLEIAAAGRHSLLMIGPPGTGKTMLASRLPGILPDMTDDEALSTAAIQSTGMNFDVDKWQQRPFRSPHHTASAVALVGGGNVPKPGEISLAHNGVLFLDELPEFNRHVLEVLREPLETGYIRISRAAYQAEFPAKFQFITAMNPCPCGYLGDTSQRCHCNAQQIQRYHNKISGPLLDRIDMHIEVPRLPTHALTETLKTHQPETSEHIKQRTTAAFHQQLERANKANAFLSSKETEKFCQLKTSDQQLLELSMKKLNLSIRAYHRILRVARTIADLAKSPSIETAHLTEALAYRKFDRYH